MSALEINHAILFGHRRRSSGEVVADIDIFRALYLIFVIAGRRGANNDATSRKIRIESEKSSTLACAYRRLALREACPTKV